MGRKNWLFSQSFERAQSSVIIMTLLETAKRNGLDLEKYINYLLTNFPNEDTLEKNEILEAYLPWNKNIQETCNKYDKSKSSPYYTKGSYSIYLVIGRLH